MRPCSARHRAQGGLFSRVQPRRTETREWPQREPFPRSFRETVARTKSPALGEEVRSGARSPEETRRPGWAGSAGCGVRNWRSGRTARSQCPMQLKGYNRVSYVFTRLNAEAHARPRPPHQIPVVRLLARTE